MLMRAYLEEENENRSQNKGLNLGGCVLAGLDVGQLVHAPACGSNFTLESSAFFTAGVQQAARNFRTLGDDGVVQLRALLHRAAAAGGVTAVRAAWAKSLAPESATAYTVAPRHAGFDPPETKVTEKGFGET